MEKLAQDEYGSALSAYAGNIANLKAKVERGVQEKQARIENALANKAREKMETILAGNIVKAQELREKQEALQNFAVQAGLAVPAVKKLGQIGSKGLSSLISKTTEARKLATISEPISEAPISAVQQAQIEPVEVEMTPQSLSSLRSKIRSAGQPVSEESGQVGKVGQNFEEDPESIGPSSAGQSALESGVETDATPALESGVTEAGAGVGEAGAEIGAEAGVEAGAEAGLALAGEAGLMALAGPVSVVAGLGFAGYEVGKMFGLFGGHDDTPKPPPPPPRIAQARRQATGIPIHRQLTIAPSLNSALIQAGR